jgi:hypothetical protein
MKNIFTKLILLFVLLHFSVFSDAQKVFFKDVKETSIKTPLLKGITIPSVYRVVQLDTTELLKFLNTVPSDKIIANHSNAPVIQIPMPNGTFNSFRIWQSSIMEPALAAKYPNLKTYTGQGIDDRTATIKIDWTEMGFHAMILSPVTTTIFIDPYSQGTKTNYISYFKSSIKPTEQFTEGELPSNLKLLNRPASTDDYEGQGPCIGTQLRTYRLAVACTHQYAIAATGFSTPTVAQTLSAIMTCVNRVDGVYEEELDIHFNLVANEDTIIFTNANNDPLGNYNSDPDNLLSQGQSIIDANIGDANYDLGQTFSTGAGGVTELSIVCVSSQKAMSATGLANPTGDVYYIDYVAHEIGHEFSAHHPFNSTLGFCGAPGQQYSGTNDEPGSGSTIMAYAEGSGPGDPGALCSTDNLQAHSDAYINAVNYDEIESYIVYQSSCAVISSTGNNAPVVNPLANYTIPLSTPFVLNSNGATDPDGDSLTYCWEEMDIGGPFGAWNEPSGDAPIFRSFSPVTAAYRYFPKLSDVINNTVTIGEIMPSYARVLHFRLTVRDNHAGGGGLCNAENAVTVDGSSGPFVVTYPDATNIIWNANDSETVTWNPAGTQSAPVSCSNVMIGLSTDGGLTYPDTILASTANTGSARIRVPNTPTTTARIRVMAIGNVFYDISNNNFTIQGIVSVSACPSSSLMLTSSITGNTYQWQVDSGNGFTNIANNAIYSGVATNILHLTKPPTSWYGYEYHCVVTGTSGISTSAAVVIKFAEQWLGGTSTAWENPVNWGCGSLPDANTDVIVSASTPFFPIVNSNPAVRSLSVTAGAKLTVNPPYNITVKH